VITNMHKKMKFSYFLCIVGILFFLQPSIACSSDDKPPPAVEICKDQPQCDFIGIDKEWPAKGFDSSSVVFTNRIFDVRLPRTLNKVSVGWGDSPLYAVWFGDHRIAIGIEDVPDERTSTEYTEIIKNKKQSSWIGTDIFKIIFNHKSKEKEPLNAYEKYLWRTAFFHKVIVYDGIESALIYKHGPWTAYSALINRATRRRLTVVTHSDIKDQYLTIRDYDLDQSFIEKIIASISLNKKL
jgi:hypothetical protein